MSTLSSFVREPWWPVAVRASLALHEVNARREVFPRSLRGACGTASIILAIVLRAHGFDPWLAGRGVGFNAHHWAVVGPWSVDCTATQFGDPAVIRVTRQKVGPTMRVATIEHVAEAFRTTVSLRHAGDPREHVPFMREVFRRVVGRDGLADIRAVIGRKWGTDRQRAARLVELLEREDAMETE